MSRLVEQLEARLLDFTRRVPMGCYTQAGGIQSHYNLLFRAHLLHSLGADADEVVRIVRQVSLQQDATGFLEVSDAVAGGVHSKLYLQLHESALLFQLADAYAVDIRNPDLLAILPTEQLKEYLATFDWRNVWLHSNVLLGVATAASFAARRGLASPHTEIMLNFVATHQPVNQFWGEHQGASRLNAMAGTFHLLPLLCNAQASVSCAAGLARSTLSLETPRGFFCAPTGYSCIEYDAAYILWALRPLLDSALATRLTGTAERLFHAMAGLQNEDGGFPEVGRPASVWAALGESAVSWGRHRDALTSLWHLKKVARLYLVPNRPFFNNSMVACAAGPYESNLFSSWLRYLTCCLAADLAGIRRFDVRRACQVVGMNYAGRCGETLAA